MPLNMVNNNRQINDLPTLQSQLQQLKNVGVDGIMMDVWWGLVERDGPQQYYWNPYVQMVGVARSIGLKVQCVMSFHQCGGNVGDDCDIPLPPWVLSVGTTNNDIFYKDREGSWDVEYLSLGVDNQVLFSGRSPVQMYQDYMSSFRDVVYKNSTDVIEGVEVSLGPAGEMRYPGYKSPPWVFCGVGEFQCYDKYMLQMLSTAACNAGNCAWGNGGPNNAGTYNSNPNQTPFYQAGTTDNYASAYGQFFLNWYASVLIQHGNLIMGKAKSVFSGYPVKIAGKVAGVHWWYKTAAHGAELTAGYYNTNGNDAYAAIAQMFKNNGASFDFTCMEMLDSSQPPDCDCGPQELVAQVKQDTLNYGVGLDGENALQVYDQGSYNTIESELAGVTNAGIFDYLRLTDTLMQSSNLATFQQFVSTMHNLS